MAHISETKSGRFLCRVGINRSVHPQISKVFDTKKEAEQWAVFRETEIQAGSLENLPKKERQKWQGEKRRQDKKRWLEEFARYLSLQKKFEGKDFFEYMTLKEKYSDLEGLIETLIKEEKRIINQEKESK
tara:strand:- start:159 stop:548 length:390 start_codon:yes stop_codon:yes gene_type:complete